MKLQTALEQRDCEALKLREVGVGVRADGQSGSEPAQPEPHTCPPEPVARVKVARLGAGTKRSFRRECNGHSLWVDQPTQIRLKVSEMQGRDVRRV